MKRLMLYLGVLICCTGMASACTSAPGLTETGTAAGFSLLPPDVSGGMALSATLAQRRSIRDFRAESLSLAQVSQLLWSAQGVTADWGGRTAPSAGGLFPLELYLVTGEVTGLAAGVYHYLPGEHRIEAISAGDRRADLAAAALGQACVEQGALNLVITAVPQRTTDKYGERGNRYVYLEAGHAAQNICLTATALGLGTVPVGAFADEAVRQVIGVSEEVVPLYVLPIGRPAA